MAGPMSKTQIDRLGDRLKKGNITEADLRLLDQYRRSFSDAYEIVDGTIRSKMGLEPTGRPAKSTTSITDKLRRESIRLTQIQDIAGCRLIVSDMVEQDSVVEFLNSYFDHTTVVDRRQKPSHGYRAVHVVARCLDKSIEIQVRTALQHLWAELSEKFSDVVDPAIKYGGGDKDFQDQLIKESASIANLEVMEVQFASLSADKRQSLVAIQGSLDSLRQDLFEYLRVTIKLVEKFREGDDDISY